MQEVLLTGATGFIGYELARHLCELRLAPRLMVHRLNHGPLLHSLCDSARPMQADLTSPHSLERIAEGVDTVFHLAARATFEPYDVLKPSNIDGSLALLEGAAKGGALKTFIYASSLMVYGPQTTPIDASTPAVPIVDYGRVKLDAEAALQKRCAELGVRFCALRLPHVYGPGDVMFTSLRKGRLICPGPGTNMYGHLHVRDAARACVLAATSGWEGISALADGQSTTWTEFFNIVDAFFPDHQRFMLPEWLAYLGTSLLKPWQWITRKPTLHTKDGVTTWNMALPVAANLLWDKLGEKPVFPTVYEGIPAVLDDCLSFRWRRSMSPWG